VRKTIRLGSFEEESEVAKGAKGREDEEIEMEAILRRVMASDRICGDKILK